MVTPMENGVFQHESCLLKHHVRANGWLPICKQRFQALKDKVKRIRRLRYFTFCAVGAIDVLMLDVARIIKRSESGKFDTVFFFDRNEEFIHETQKRIPGAIGFPGNFTEIVLLQDPNEEQIVDNPEPLESPTEALDEAATHRLQMQLAQRQQFIRSFPFDVINLDLEEFFFKPNDPLPGRVVNALRKVFEWQGRTLTTQDNRTIAIDGFSLMFTTQVGPPNLGADYLGMMEQYLRDNLQQDDVLREILIRRYGSDDVHALRVNDFASFFKLAMPKVLAHILMEKDWYIDPNSGVVIYEFQRPSATGPYTILHLIMDVRRFDPPRERRAPGQQPLPDAYRQVVRGIFEGAENVVTEDNVDQATLRISLEKIAARRRKYYADDEGIPL